ncbi:MAG: DUF3592 domain-containing protein [Bacteroidetes bacterium]|nr:DUF3592 domain-containing protein [Bacteroidota bacterium]
MLKWMLFVFALLVGSMAVYYGAKLFRMWRRMSRWTICDGELISKKTGPRKLSSGGRANKVILAKYRFSVNGKSFTGNTVFPIEILKGEKGFLQKDAEKLLEKITPVVKVHYDPIDPETNILFPGGPGLALLMIGMGIFTLIFGIALVIVR